MSYYYLMAQLPYLIFEQRPPMTSAAFMSLCETLLSKGDLALMKSLSLDPQPSEGRKKRLQDEVVSAKYEGPTYSKSAPASGCGFIDSWREWERALRLNLAKDRAIKKGREDLIQVEPPHIPQDAVNTAAKAVSSSMSPLEGEMIIDKARWNVIDNLVGIDYFNRRNVFAYFLKLLLLERRQSFNTERGLAEYKSLYAAIVDSNLNKSVKIPGEPK